MSDFAETTCGQATPRRAAAGAARLGGVCDLDRDHGADRGHGPERRRPGRPRRPRGSAGLPPRLDRDRPRLVRLHPPDELLQPRRLRVCPRGRDARAPRGLLRLLGPPRNLLGLPRGELRRDRPLRRVLLQRHRDLGQPGLGDHLARRGRADLALRLQRHQGGDALAPRLRGDLGRARHHPDRHHLREGDRRERAERPGLHAQAVRPRGRSRAQRGRVRIGLRLPLLRRLRRRGRARRGDEQPAPQRPARDRRGGRVLRDLLHARHARPVARLRDRPGGDRRLLELLRAARRALEELRRRRHGRRDQSRRDAQRVRQRPRLRRRGGEAPLRHGARRVRDDAARRHLAEDRRADHLARSRDALRGRSSASRSESTGRRP